MADKSDISINWGGLNNALDRATTGLSETKNLMRNVGVTMKAQTVRRFQEGKSPDDEAWKKSRRAEASGGQTLVDTARLRNSITFNASALDVHVGSNLEYARIHQLGGKAGRGRKVSIPARPYLGLSEEDQEEVAALVAEHMEGGFK